MDKKALLDGYKEIMAKEPVSASFVSVPGQPEAVVDTRGSRPPIFGVINDPNFEAAEEEEDIHIK